MFFNATIIWERPKEVELTMDEIAKNSILMSHN